jgi:hypothetical protein
LAFKRGIILSISTIVKAIIILIPKGHTFRLSRQAAQLSFIPQGHKFRLSRQAAQLSFILLENHLCRKVTTARIPPTIFDGAASAGIINGTTFKINQYDLFFSSIYRIIHIYIVPDGNNY